MNLENLNVIELNAQEKLDRNAGGWWGYLFDLYYGNGAGDVHGACGQAVNGNPSYTDAGYDASLDLDGVQA